jgi:hypothetical protein
MLIALATGVMTMTLPDGTTQTVNLDNVVDVSAERGFRVIYGTTTATSGTGSLNVIPPAVPLAGGISTQLQSQQVDQYFVRLHFNDNRWLDLLCGEQTGDGVLWVNTLAGANIGRAAIVAQM